MGHTIWRTFIGLTITTLVIFALVFFFFRDHSYINFSDDQFLVATRTSMAFGLTTLYALVAAYNVVTVGKKTKLSFGKTFKLTFVPGFFAGVVSLVIIFGVLYYYAPEAVEQLKEQFFESSRAEAVKGENADEILKRIDAAQDISLLTGRTLSLGIILILFFNISLSLMLSFLWKVRNTPSK